MQVRWSVVLVVGLVASCGSTEAPTSGPARAAPDAVTADASSNAGASSARPSCVSADRLRAWQTEIDQFDGGYRPTGSAAHEGYIALLAKELTALGVTNVHTEPYAFRKWSPSSWSLAWRSGLSPGVVAVSGYVPYSGSTGPGGVTAGMVHIPTTTIPVDASALRSALSKPDAWNQTVTAALGQALATLTVAGKIALFDVPRAAVTVSTLTGQRIYANDPGNTLPPEAKLERIDLSAMLYVPGMLNALAAAGAVGAIGILDTPEEAARGEYAPFFGSITRNMPALYVDRATGNALRSAVAASGSLAAVKLVLDAELAAASSENLIGVLPGASSEEILVGSHTDGPNSMEDNGPVAILALASCLPAARPRTVRFVLSGGHFVGSLGLQSYVAAHAADLTNNALAVLEVEHLGARAWTEVSPGVMGLTGEPEVQIVTTWPNAPLVAASTAYAKLFPRTIVGEPPVIGEGPNFRIVPLVQIISMPEYLLLGHLPAITSQMTDYALMERQVDAIVAMEKTLALAPASQLGVGH
jgi:hypothetical protein